MAECLNDESLVKELREAQLLGDEESLKRKPAEAKPTQEDLMTMKEADPSKSAGESHHPTDLISA